jgi:hypothetical protein
MWLRRRSGEAKDEVLRITGRSPTGPSPQPAAPAGWLSTLDVTWSGTPIRPKPGGYGR